MQNNSQNRYDVDLNAPVDNPNAPGHFMQMTHKEHAKLRQRRQQFAGRLVKFIFWTVLIIIGLAIIAYAIVQNNPELVVQKLLGSSMGGPPSGGGGSTVP